MRRDIELLVIGPSATTTTGSLLRPYNIWYTLKGLSTMNVRYLPITYPIEVLLNIRSIIRSNIIIISGVSPWISAMILIVSRLLGKCVILDVHGSPYYEHIMSGRVRIIRELLLYVNEYISYRLSTNIIVASRGLIGILHKYFRVRLNKRLYVLPNSISYLFMKIIKPLMGIDRRLLWNVLLKPKLNVDIDNNDTKIVISPLPDVFIGNLIAYDTLMNMIRELRSNNIRIIITGIRKELKRIDSFIINVGYLPYIDYITLLLNAQAILLPYPNNSVCGGVRNKVLEAGYCGVPLISTKNGVLHLDAKGWIHYIPLEEVQLGNLLINIDTDAIKSISENMRMLILEKYLPNYFSRNLLTILREILRRRFRKLLYKLGNY